METTRKTRRKTLMSFVKSGNVAAFRSYIKKARRVDFSAADEAAFMQNAPATWIRIFLRRNWPTAKAEQILLGRNESDLIALSCAKWGGPYAENIVWAFQNGSDTVCKRIVDLAKWQDDQTESLLLTRSDMNLLRRWLRKFHALGEDAERKLNEDISLQSLKQAYIADQMARVP